jgi:ApaG protein
VNRIPRRSRSRGSPIYEARTRDILVRILCTYLPQESDPAGGLYVWAYVVEIENHGLETVQLISRHWIITDARNHVEEVQGEGVVGEQPVLKPREAYRYTSGCPLRTSSGSMHGTFQMVTDDGEPFDAVIPPFSLDLPDARKVMN